MEILVCGAGVAGLAAAAQFADLGHSVTVLELAPHIRTTGTPLDIRGDALGVAREVGILDQLEQHRLSSTTSTQFVDGDGYVVGSFPADAISDSPDDLEVAREDLMKILLGWLPSSVPIRFGTTIEELRDGPEGIDAVFSDGSAGRYELVIGTDGIHSKVRRLIFGPENDYLRHLGIYVAISRLAPGGAGGPSQLYNVPGRLAGIYRYRDQAVAVFMFRSPQLSYDYADRQAQRDYLLAAFQHQGWRVPELIASAEADEDLYFDAVAQIRMDTWHNGRVVLAGDAAHCAALLSGRGTSLALTGARFLVEEVDAADGDLTAAFSRYEERQRPYAEAAQQSVDPQGDMMIPATQEALDERNKRLAPGMD